MLQLPLIRVLGLSVMGVILVLLNFEPDSLQEPPAVAVTGPQEGNICVPDVKRLWVSVPA